MARTNQTLVRGILLDDYNADDDPSLDPFITTASSIVDAVAAAGQSRGIAVTTAQLQDIETWLAAHVYVQSDQVEQAVGEQGATTTFQGRTAMYLESSKYGQMAISLDPTGYLASLARGRRRVFGAWLGTPNTTRNPYGF